MGLFSTVINQCPILGEEFLGELQTKDFECLMDTYWISPNGEIFLLEWGGAFTLKEDPDADKWYEKFRWERTGQHGKLVPYRKNVIARLYPARGSDEWIEVHAFFRNGALVEVLA